MHAAGLLAISLLTAAQPALPAYLGKDARDALTPWLAAHRAYRVLEDADCRCDEGIRQTRTQSTGAWKAVPNYHPYYATGDFNGDGRDDLAVAVKSNADGGNIRILILNSFRAASADNRAAYLSPPLGARVSLAFGAPRPKPYRLVVGPFESEGMIFVPAAKELYRME